MTRVGLYMRLIKSVSGLGCKQLALTFSLPFLPITVLHISYFASLQYQLESSSHTALLTTVKCLPASVSGSSVAMPAQQIASS